MKKKIKKILEISVWVMALCSTYNVYSAVAPESMFTDGNIVEYEKKYLKMDMI